MVLRALKYVAMHFETVKVLCCLLHDITIIIYGSKKDFNSREMMSVQLPIKLLAGLLLLTLSFASFSAVCPDVYFVTDPDNRWSDSFDGGLKNVQGVGFGTLFLAGGPSELNNLNNVTRWVEARILNGVLTCVYDADVQLLSSLRIRFREQGKNWRMGICIRSRLLCEFSSFR